jgi:hypothetical protein
MNFGFGFYGRVRVNEIDLRPWTFMSGDRIVSTRVDQAALTTDAIRQRLQRGDANRDIAVVSGLPARFSRSEIKDPAATIARRGIGSGAGREGSGSATDMTPFFRRDPELSNAVRERIVRSAIAPGGAAAVVSSPRGSGLPAGSGVPSPGTPGTIEGRVPPHGDSPDAGRPTVPRDRFRDNPSAGTATPQSPSSADRGAARNWRDRLDRSTSPTAPADRAPADRAPAPAPSRDDSWRGRVSGRRDATPRADAPVDRAPLDRGYVERKPVDRAPADRGSDIPRRIIDRIGGARIYGGDTPRDTTPRQSTAPREAPPPRAERSSPPPPPPTEHSAPPPSRSNDGGHVKRDR